MVEAIRLEGCIDEYAVGYNARMEIYTNLSSDINELYEIGGG